MGRLYSLVGADSHTDPEYGRFEPDDAGAFDFPDDVSDVLGGFAVKGKKLWETEEARAERLHGLDMARRRDPATLLATMEDNAALNAKVVELMAMLAAAQTGQQAAPAHPTPADGDSDGEPAADGDSASDGDADGDDKAAPAARPASSRAARTSKSATKA